MACAGDASRPGLVGRDAERQRIDDFVARLAGDARSLVLVGEAGIGKTTLWNYGVARCRAVHARVLVARPTEEDAHSPDLGLRDLLDPRHVPDGVPAEAILGADLSVLDRSRLVLELLQGLARRGPVVLAVDDLPWLDDVTGRVLRFALRRLLDEPVALLATARTWSPETLRTPLRQVDRGMDLLEVGAMPTTELRRIVTAAVPSITTAAATQAGDLAHGNPFFAIELARVHGGATGASPDGSPLAALATRVAGLPAVTLNVVRLLAVAGPSPLGVLSAACGSAGVEESLRAALDADIVTLDEDFVVRFTHPLIATAVLRGTNVLDRRSLHAALAETATDRDARAVHLAHAVVDPDEAVAREVEAAAQGLARRGAPRLAADLLAHSARLTPAEDVDSCVRRSLARMMHCATAGDLSTALDLAGSLLDGLEPGPLRAEVVTGRVVLDFTDAERFLRVALEDVPPGGDQPGDLLHGRLLGLLGWLLAIHLGRLQEGLEYARAGLEIGRAHGDAVLIAQAASAVSTASLLLGRRADDLIDEAVARGPEVVRSQLALWPRVLQGRQQVWDGRIAQARANLGMMYRASADNGADFHRPYRLVDLAHVSLAAGDLDLAARQLDDGMEAARDCRDERALSWLAYPAGLLAALRGDAAAAEWSADRLEWWAARVAERPRQAMASHVRGLLAAAAQDWTAGLDHLMAGLAVLDHMGYSHPGAIPVLPQAIQLAALAGALGHVEPLVTRLRAQCHDLASPWASAQLISATGQLLLMREEPEAFVTLGTAHDQLEGLGYRLDAARTGYFAAAAAIRAGQRRRARSLAEDAVATFGGNGVRAWDALCQELLDRARGATGDELTATEGEIARLVACGRRNREIAARLFVSESTVEAHLTRVYRKLGLRNRAELSRRLAPVQA